VLVKCREINRVFLRSLFVLILLEGINSMRVTLEYLFICVSELKSDQISFN